MKFDIELQKPYSYTVIHYGVIRGSDTVVLTKTGLNGQLPGYEDKYLKIASLLHQKYGVTVVCSSNPYKNNNPLDTDMSVIKEVLGKDPETVYYMGHSNGASIGGFWGYKYPCIKRLLLVNPPLMWNWPEMKKGLKKFQGEKATVIIGSKDQSAEYGHLIDFVKNERVRLVELQDTDHHFTNRLEEFIALPDEYLCSDTGIIPIQGKKKRSLFGLSGWF